MGAYLNAPIQGDGDHPEYVVWLSKLTAFVFMDMVEPWHKTAPNHEAVSHAAIAAANDAVPWTLQGFLTWRRESVKLDWPASWGERFIYEDHEITQQSFDQVRDALKRCAKEGWGAEWSP